MSTKLAAAIQDCFGTIQDFLYCCHCCHLDMDIPDKCGGAGESDIFLLLVIKSFPVNFEH